MGHATRWVAVHGEAPLLRCLCDTRRQRQADHEQDEAHDLGRGLPAPGGNRQGDEAHEPRRQHGIDRLERRHRQSLAAVEPVINHRGQGIGKAEIGPDGHHEQIEHAKGPETGGVAQRQEPAPAHERPHPQHPARAPAVQTPARPQAGRPALGPRQRKDERHSGVARAKAIANRRDEDGEAAIDGGLVQGAEKAPQPDHPPPVKHWGARGLLGGASSWHDRGLSSSRVRVGVRSGPCAVREWPREPRPLLVSAPVEPALLRRSRPSDRPQSLAW